MSSEWWRMAHLVYLTITYQLVKLFGAALKKAAKIESKAGIEMRYFWNRDVVESGMVVVRMSFRLDYVLPSSGK